MKDINRPRTLGIDFDNTLVTYDHLIHAIATERGLIANDFNANKKEIRDSIRQLVDGDIEWQKIQGLIYGPQIHKAIPSPGVVKFLTQCKTHGYSLVLVSHKTEFANYDETGTNLRVAAMNWLRDNQLLGLVFDGIFFESTRIEKLNRIGMAGCQYFVDDLEETFDEDSFPKKVGKILYTTNDLDFVSLSLCAAGNWDHISDYLFHG